MAKSAAVKLNQPIKLQIEIPKLITSRLEVTIKGLSPLLANPKTRTYLEDIERGGKKAGRGKQVAKDPQREFEERLNRLSDGSYGWPLEAFTGKTGLLLSALSLLDARKMGLSSKNIFAAVQIEADEIVETPEGPRAMLRLEGSPPVVDRHFATIRSTRAGSGGTPIPIYRPRWDEWSLRLRLTFNARLISPDQIITLLVEAGRGIGLGAWRRANGGAFGTFSVEQVVQFGE